MFWPVVKLLPFTSQATSEAISSEVAGTAEGRLVDELLVEGRVDAAVAEELGVGHVARGDQVRRDPIGSESLRECRRVSVQRALRPSV